MKDYLKDLQTADMYTTLKAIAVMQERCGSSMRKAAMDWSRAHIDPNLLLRGSTATRYFVYATHIRPLWC